MPAGLAPPSWVGISLGWEWYWSFSTSHLQLPWDPALFLWHAASAEPGLWRYRPEWVRDPPGLLLLITISYTYILTAILRIPSNEGRKKPFSTCPSHFTVVIVHYGCASFMYLRPKASYSLERDHLIAVTYTVVTPLLNLTVYSLRNWAVQTALRNAFWGRLLGKRWRLQ